MFPRWLRYIKNKYQSSFHTCVRLSISAPQQWYQRNRYPNSFGKLSNELCFPAIFLGTSNYPVSRLSSSLSSVATFTAFLLAFTQHVLKNPKPLPWICVPIKLPATVLAVNLFSQANFNADVCFIWCLHFLTSCSLYNPLQSRFFPYHFN